MARRAQYLFLQDDITPQYPDDLWNAVAWNLDRASVDLPLWCPEWQDLSTTVAVASNGAVLPGGGAPLATLTPTTMPARMPRKGYLGITVGGTRRVVRYNSRTDTVFQTITGGVGTLTTGDVIELANVTILPPENKIAAVVAEVAFVSNATGVRGIRTRFMDDIFNLPGGGCVVPSAASPAAAPLTIPCQEQPAGSGTLPGTATQGMIVEVYQNSGTVGGLAGIVDPTHLGRPRLVTAEVLSR